jgi:Family of unknown function (DUF5908)
MPIEIRELVIKATVQQEGQGTNATGDAGNNSVSLPEQIISACIEKLNESIKERNER